MLATVVQRILKENHTHTHARARLQTLPCPERVELSLGLSDIPISSSFWVAA